MALEEFVYVCEQVRWNFQVVNTKAAIQGKAGGKVEFP